MKLSSVNDLEKLHAEILQLRVEYLPSESLLLKVDEKWREWMHGRNGGGYYPWLALAVRLLKPRRILELGNYLGASTLMMYSELTPKTELFTSVDLVQNLAFLPEEVFADPRMQFIFGNDLNLNIFGESLPVDLDLIFIDTLHEWQHLEDEWAIYQHLCTPGALIVLDDIWVNDMWKFWEALPYPKLDITTDCHQSGFGIFIYQPQDQVEQFPESDDQKALRAYRIALEITHRRLAVCRREIP